MVVLVLYLRYSVVENVRLACSRLSLLTAFREYYTAEKAGTVILLE